MPNPEDILSVSPDHVSDFINHQINAKTLSTVMRRLNADLLSEDESASMMAERALRHLGFQLDTP